MKNLEDARAHKLSTMVDLGSGRKDDGSYY